MLLLATLLLSAPALPQGRAPETLSLDAHAERVRSVAFSTAGGLLSTGDDWTVRAWDVSTGAVRWDVAGDAGGAGAISLCAAPAGDVWVRGGQAIDGGELVAYAAVARTGGETLATWRGDVGEGASVALSGDGATVVVATRDWLERPGHAGRLLTWRWQSEGVVERYRADGVSFLSVDVSSDGAMLAAGRADGAALVFRGDAGEPLVLGRHRGPTGDLDLTSDGALLATAGGGEIAFLWDTASGEPRRELRFAACEVRAVAFGPAGELAVGGSRVKEVDGAEVRAAFVEVWELEGVEPMLRLAPAGESVLSLDYSGDGAQLAAGLEGGALRLWDVRRALNALRVAGR